MDENLLDNKWILFCGVLDIALSPSKKGGSNAKLELGFKYTWVST